MVRSSVLTGSAMSPATDPGLFDGAAPAELLAEGAGYAVALLHRIAADASSPADLVAVFQFLHHPAALGGLLQAQPMLQGFAVTIFNALRLALAPCKGPTQ